MRWIGALIVAGGVAAAAQWAGAGPLHWYPGWAWIALAGVVAAALPGRTAVRVAAWIAVAAFTAWRIVPLGLWNDEAWRLTIALICPCVAAVVVGLGRVSRCTRPSELLGWIVSALLVLAWSGAPASCHSR